MKEGARRQKAEVSMPLQLSVWPLVLLLDDSLLQHEEQGWQFNRLFGGQSFGQRIGPSFGPRVKLKRSYV